MTFRSLELARVEHELSGGYLLDAGGVYEVTGDHPSDHKSFATEREAISWALAFAAAGYDETRMEITA